jgi:hypothetical protein
VIGDLVVAPEANEITAALTLLKGLPRDCQIFRVQGRLSIMPSRTFGRK